MRVKRFWPRLTSSVHSSDKATTSESSESPAYARARSSLTLPHSLCPTPSAPLLLPHSPCPAPRDTEDKTQHQHKHTRSQVLVHIEHFEHMVVSTEKTTQVALEKQFVTRITHRIWISFGSHLDCYLDCVRLTRLILLSYASYFSHASLIPPIRLLIKQAIKRLRRKTDCTAMLPLPCSTHTTSNDANRRLRAHTHNSYK